MFTFLITETSVLF